MKILIVEDDDEKRSKLESFIRFTYKVDEVSSARSFQSGLRAILEDCPDLILLDMTMRNFDRTLSEEGGRPHAFAGREILRQMRRHRVNIPVLVVTHFDRFGDDVDYMTIDELKSELSTKFANYLGTVQYKSNVDDWQSAIAAAVSGHLSRKDDTKC